MVAPCLALLEDLPEVSLLAKERYGERQLEVGDGPEFTYSASA